MTKTKAVKKPTPATPNNALKVNKTEEEDLAFATAREILAPGFRHAITASQIHKAQFGSMESAPGYGDYAEAIRVKGDAAAKGNLAFVSRMLAAQAVTLDNIFTELARRMALNMGEHLNPTDIYARHAMKAQAQSRATLEALVKIHQPREQTVKHVHVNQGGQAVVADEFHHHPGGTGNANSIEQCHAARNTGGSTALPGPDPLGVDMPITSGSRETAMSDARRD
jgi:hypothetical protein